LRVNKGDTELLKLANDVIKELDQNGEAKKMVSWRGTIRG
jgi:uncharacterized protein (DUF305 family)